MLRIWNRFKAQFSNIPKPSEMFQGLRATWLAFVSSPGI